MDLEKLNLDQICKELDSMSLRMLQLMREYINVKITIEDLIKNGCLHLAKSRYIMGNRNVSALQLPTECSSNFFASTTVLMKESDNVEEMLTLELCKLNINDNVNTTTTNDSEIPRQRNKNKKENYEDNEKNIDDNGTQPSVQDPLKWFGVLVPQDMRQAQSNFSKAIEYVVQCANIQLEILAIEQKYRRYYSKKLQLTKID